MARAMATRPKEVNDPGVCTTNSGTWKQPATEVKVPWFPLQLKNNDTKWQKKYQVPTAKKLFAL